MTAAVRPVAVLLAMLCSCSTSSLTPLAGLGDPCRACADAGACGPCTEADDVWTCECCGGFLIVVDGGAACAQ